MADHCEAEDLNLTIEEANRLKNAFADKDFLKLFQDYMEDVNSVESREAFEKDVIAMEKDRGYDVKFVHPDPVYVIKFVSNDEKIFVNICKNQYVGEPTCEKKNDGSEWKVPSILSKLREDLDKKRTKCTVIDVMFHPTTMNLACGNIRFKELVEDTAVSLVREQFSINLDVKSAVRPKMKYKGKAPPVILRRNPNRDSTCEPIGEYYKKLLSNNQTKCPTVIKPKSDFKNPKEHEKSSTMIQNSKEISKIVRNSNESVNSTTVLNSKEFGKPTTTNKNPKEPIYLIKYRDILDLKDYSLLGYTDKVAPKQIVVEIHLPEVQKALDVDLDVLEKRIQLKSCPGKSHDYVLDLNLSYDFDKNSCTAKFDSKKKVLEVVLPVKERAKIDI